MNNGALEKAVEKYLEALNLDSGNFRARYHCTKTLARLGHYNEALLHAKKLIEMFPGECSAFRLAAKVYARRGELEEAKECLRMALGMDTDSRNGVLDDLYEIMATEENSQLDLSSSNWDTYLDGVNAQDFIVFEDEQSE